MHKKLLKPVYLKLVSRSGRANFLILFTFKYRQQCYWNVSLQTETIFDLIKSLAKDEIFFMVTLFILRRILSGNWHGHITRTGLSWWALGEKRQKGMKSACESSGPSDWRVRHEATRSIYGLLVHRSVTPSRYPFIQVLWESSVLPKNTTQCYRSGLEAGPLDPETSALTMRPPRLWLWKSSN